MRAETGIALLSPDLVIQTRGAGAGLPVAIVEQLTLPFAKTLLAEPGARVPFDLLPAAWQLLEQWDLAVPMWKYGVTAADEGSNEERQRTATLVGDVRVPLHAYELLFLRDGKVGQAFLQAWEQEGYHSGHRRHAFLRALHRVKPLTCILPRTWLLDVRAPAPISGRRRGVVLPTTRPLVRVQVAPGRFVQVHQGDEEKALAQFRATQLAGRRTRQGG